MAFTDDDFSLQAKINRDLTIVIFSVVSILAGTFTLFLPESNGKTLPDTLEEGKYFSTFGGVYKPRGQTRGKGGCSDDHNT